MQPVLCFTAVQRQHFGNVRRAVFRSNVHAHAIRRTRNIAGIVRVPGSLSAFRTCAIKKKSRTSKKQRKRTKIALTAIRKPFRLRRGRDSNPRCPERHNGFRDRPVQPLRHPSVTHRRRAIHPRRKDRPARSISGERINKRCGRRFRKAPAARKTPPNGWRLTSIPAAPGIFHAGRNAPNVLPSARGLWKRNPCARGTSCISMPAPCVRSAPGVALP